MQLDKAQIEELVAQAAAARQEAYAPYSEYAVGAALLTGSGQIYTGANVENASYSLTMCAERNAAFQAVASGDREFSAIAVVTERGGAPCGACRQVLSEFANSMYVIIVDASGEILEQVDLDRLIPHAFGPADLSSS